MKNDTSKTVDTHHSTVSPVQMALKEKNGTKGFFVGDVVSIQDVASKGHETKTSTDLYVAKILKVEADRCFVHFNGWKKTYDRWVPNAEVKPAACAQGREKDRKRVRAAEMKIQEEKRAKKVTQPSH